MRKTGILVYLFAFLAALFGLAAVGAAIFCTNAKPVLLDVPPEASAQMEKLLRSLCDGDAAGAEAVLYGDVSLDLEEMPENPVHAMIWKAYLQSLDYVLEGDLYASDTGLAQDVKLISMDLEAVTENLGTRARTLLNQAVETAEDPAELYNENNDYREELVMEVLQQAACQALESDMRYTYQRMTLRLIYEDQWLVIPGDGWESALDRFEMYMSNVTSEALEGVLSLEKVYWLHDADMVAPKPDPANYGEATDPGALAPVIEGAAKLLQDRELIFRTDTALLEDSSIHYYLDDTILAITWQHTVGKAVYTCSEVVIAHPSQFRRFLSDGQFGSGKLYQTTEMAASVNAVTASNGDYYAYRGYGNIVYNGEVKMAGNRYLDTCYVDENGDLILMDYGGLYKREDLEDFVKENKIRFSLAFGPILLRDGKVVAKHYYPLGETDDFYSRSALCQIGPLHYMLVTVNRRGQDVTRFAKHLQEMGVPAAYALDGGQTSTIVTGNKLINPVDYGGEREISDIIYFATALPDGG